MLQAYSLQKSKTAYLTENVKNPPAPQDLKSQVTHVANVIAIPHQTLEHSEGKWAGLTETPYLCPEAPIPGPAF
jgi:hypothetical protein